jgi:DNA polymerase-3 subunit delta
VIYGDEPFQKQAALDRALSELLPPDVDRAMALVTYDGEASEDLGGPSFAAVADDLATIPLMADRRVVVIRDADKFITTARERLERWVTHPPATGTLILECRSFPKTTKLAKAAVKAGGALNECKQLRGRDLADFLNQVARTLDKRLEPAAAGRLLALIGQDQGVLAMEVEKLALFVGQRATITPDDVATLVGLTREEKIFAVMDAAGLGQAGAALDLWRQVLATDRQAAFRAVGGLAFVLRKWLSAHRMIADGLAVRDIAPKVMMYGRQEELQTILRRLPPARLARSLAALARLDAQAKRGQRSIETAIEGVLVDVATPAA